MHDASALDSGQTIYEAEQVPAVVESAGLHAADALRHLENARRHDVAEGFTPRFALQRNAGIQLGARLERAHFDRRAIDDGGDYHGLVAALSPNNQVRPGAGS